MINLGLIKEGRWEDVTADIAAVKQAVPDPKILKVIIESAVLTDDEIVQACQAAEKAGADFVKTSTGFHHVAAQASRPSRSWLILLVDVWASKRPAVSATTRRHARWSRPGRRV
ncbi:deoxyribose-phosphate aldolase [Cutibacterium acnes JCM 18920]|nr:deoxyribose-phosphate aldolase [Cutibacterium acnes JCM 18920]